MFSSEVHFRVNSTNIDRSYLGNTVSIDSLKAIVDSLGPNFISRIEMVSKSSPEGSYETNERLSRGRMESTRKLLLSSYPELEPYITSGTEVEAWDELLNFVARDTVLEDSTRRMICHFIQDDIDLNMRKELIQSSPEYKYIFDTYYHRIRRSGFVLYKLKVPEPDMTIEISDFDIDYGDDMYRIPNYDTLRRAAMPILKPSWFFDVHTNLVYDAFMTPNIGAEFYIKKGFSVGANWGYAWWNNQKKFWWRLFGGDVYARWHFGKKAKEKPMQGHHVGVFLGMLTYDVDWGNVGYIADYKKDKFSVFCGVEYGYSLPVAERLNIDFNIGLGYLGGQYRVYQPQMNWYPEEMHYVWEETRRRNWIGPVKLEVSLKYLLGRDNYNKGKKNLGK